MDKEERAIVTVIGQDRVGIISGVATVLAEHNVNILDISQTVLQEFFTMMMVVDLKGCRVDFNRLQQELVGKGASLGVQVQLQHADIFRYMHRI
ncbi:MAG: ACT domain-containing protein [Firmicutes bacterium]|nr:ACT domain-containing protein [Bacillota bacterium]